MITVFTPTYNRAHLLPVLYESLRRQTSQDFEWILVDDGSTDGTEKLAKSWEKDAAFPLLYFRQENGGKHRAINLGVSKANTDWLFIVDSDDYLTDNAIETIHHWILEPLPDNIAGVAGTRVNPKGEILWGFPNIPEGTCLEARNNERKKYGLEKDKAEVYRTSILKKYPFPAFAGEKFISEVVVWDQIAADGYALRWYRDPLIICEYRTDGLTAANNSGDLIRNNFQGFTCTAKVRMKAHTGPERMIIFLGYVDKAKKLGLDNRTIANNLEMDLWKVQMASVLARVKRGVKKD